MKLPHYFTLPYFLIVAFIMVSIFVVDFEHNIILDEQSFLLLILTLSFFLLSDFSEVYSHIFAGFFSSFILLAIHLITKGKGMGLGDVKLAIAAGMILGLKAAFAWLYLSFIIGAIVGLALILLKKAKFGREIAFGPFLVISFFITLFWGDRIMSIIFPFF